MPKGAERSGSENPDSKTKESEGNVIILPTDDIILCRTESGYILDMEEGALSHTIELHKVSKYYANDETVSMGFSRIDLDLDIGEFVAITGESGSGKSTLLNVISGLDTYEEGEMFVCGEDTTAYGTQDYERYRKTYIGNIFQDFNLINSYSVYQNIEAVMLLSGKRKSECRERILELIEKVGLSEYTHTKASRLSGGQKQRVAIARALAKDAPIIVADEPTGNLDSASAMSVMETLSRVSADKLVVVVTHNYDQAEPYVTRKLTMHDGRIIEDKTFPDKAAGTRTCEEPADIETGRNNMGFFSELRLGVRNTFNIPAKFMLLFLVYFFVATAVLSQYASSINSMHEGELLGYNEYFTNSTPERIVLKKQDNTPFTEEDIASVEAMNNIDYVVRNDLCLDKGVFFSRDDMYVEGPLYPIEMIDESMLTYGTLPGSDTEVVVRADTSSDAYYTLSEGGESLIGSRITLQDYSGMTSFDFGSPVKICGIILDEQEDESGSMMGYGYSKIYAGEKISRRIMTQMMHDSSNVRLDFGGTVVTSEYEKLIHTSGRVPSGKCYILEDQSYYYDDGKAIGKKVSVKADNHFFSSAADFTIEDIVTEKNITKLLGMPKSEYDMYYDAVFINPKDFDRLFDKGYYQISAFMLEETDSDSTVSRLENAGFTAFPMKEALTDVTGGFNGVLQMIAYVRLIVEFIILFYIAYAVIRLIMRSRNSYYSTLRILGATKRNTDNILRTELIIMMLVAYGVDILFVFLVRSGLLKLGYVQKLLYFLTVPDYVMLGVLLLAMSLLIARRYSRKIFSKSAMKSFRGEVQ